VNKRKVVITGLGAVTALGLSFEDTFKSLLNGESGVSPAKEDILAIVPGALAASVSKEFVKAVPRTESLLDRATQFGLAAAREAIADAAFQPTAAECGRVGVYVGTGMGGADSLDPMYSKLIARRLKAEVGDPASVHPLAVPRIMPNSTASWLSIYQGYRGPTYTYSVACSSSAVALGEAYRSILHGYADAIVVIGTESFLTPPSFAAWNALRVMAATDEEDLKASCKPFDRKRTGFVLGEGAAAVVLESEEFAARRGRRIYGSVVGFGCTSDASHITLPSRDGQSAAMRIALQELSENGLSPTDIGYVNAHGTATPAGDVTETESMKDAFGPHAAHLAISSTKSMHGHLIGAAGALEFAVSIKAMVTGSIPPTANLRDQDPACDLDYVPVTARHGLGLKAVMSNSFAFGGTNASLIALRADS
jgi:3-oxoacyl-(acyl-carrier-protein) synthase